MAYTKYISRPEHPFDIRPDLRKAASTKAESTTAESVIRPKQLVRTNNSIKSYQTDNDIVLATKRSIFGNYSRERQVKRQYFYLL